MAKENFLLEEEEINLNHNPHVTPPSSIGPTPKTVELLNLCDNKKSSPICKNTFQGDQSFSFGRKVKIFLKKGGKNDGEGCRKGVNSLQRPVCQLSVPSIKDG